MAYKSGMDQLPILKQTYYIWEAFVRLFVYPSPKVLPDNTPQYLGQMMSDLHKNFSKCKYWSPRLIKNVVGPAQRTCTYNVYTRTHTSCANLHATYKPSYLSSMKSDLYQNRYNHWLGNKDPPITI